MRGPCNIFVPVTDIPTVTFPSHSAICQKKAFQTPRLRQNVARAVRCGATSPIGVMRSNYFALRQKMFAICIGRLHASAQEKHLIGRPQDACKSLHVEGRPMQGEALWVAHALRNAKCAPQNAMTAPRHRAATPASTPEIVGIALGAEAAWPAPASNSTPTTIKNCRIRGGI